MNLTTNGSSLLTTRNIESPSLNYELVCVCSVETILKDLD